MERNIIKRGLVANVGLNLPIELEETILNEEESYYIVLIDGVEWFTSHSKMHAIILYELLKDHVTEFMHYENKHKIKS